MLSQHLLSPLALAVAASGLAIPGQPLTERSSDPFQHPGALHTAADFTRIKSKVDAQAEPWFTSWNKLIAKTNTTYVPKPHAIIARGDNPNVGPDTYQDLYRDIEVAYTSAIRWKVEGQSEYADSAIGILDAWSAVVTTINGTSDKYLASGIYGYQLANTAEILRTYDGWERFDATVNMLQNIFYPMNHEFLIDHNDNALDVYWANWDLCNIASMQAIGILSGNASIYDEAVDYFKNGGGNGQIENAIWKLYDEEGYPEKQLGQCQESGRDQGHSLLNFALLGVIGTQSFSQGDDLFDYLDSRILAGAEYTAKYNVNNSVPYTTYSNSLETQTVISSEGRGEVRPAWELLYAHYGSLKGQNASWTESMRDYVVEMSGGAEGGGKDYGPNSGAYDQLGYGTLMFRLE